MPAGADIYQVIGFILEVKDLASGVVTKAQRVIDVAVSASQTALEGLITAAERVDGAVADLGRRGFGLVKTGAVGAYVGVNRLFQTTLSLVKLGGSLGKAGLFGLLLGPLAPILSLLSPIIDALSRAFAPALETISDLIDAAFAPFAGLLDTVAQSLFPLIQRALRPFIELLMLGAAQVGVFLQGLTDTADTGDMLGGVLTDLMPSFSSVFDGLVEVGKAVLPVIIQTVKMLIPILARVVKMVADAVAKVLPILARVIERTLPKLVDAMGAILEAVLPLIPPLLHLGVVLLEKVFAPLLVVTIEKIAEGINLVAKFLTEKVIPVVVPFIEDVTAQVDAFYSNFSGNMRSLYVLFLKPILDWFSNDLPAMFSGAYQSVSDFLSSIWGSGLIGDWWDSLTNFFSHGWETITSIFDFSGLTSSVGGIFDTMLGSLQAPVGALKKSVNDYVVSPLNSLLTYDLPLLGPLGKILNISSIPGLAEGGIATMPTLAGIGEARPEAVVPLDAESITRFVQPVVQAMPSPQMEMPEFRGVVTTLQSIERLLRGTISVKVAGEGGGAEARPSGGGGNGSKSSDDRDLDAAVGAEGLSWAGG